MNGMGQLGRIYGLREGVEDPGAAQEAIGELADIVEQYLSDGASFNLGRELVGWFKANLEAIQAALGIEDHGDEGGLRDEARLPKLGTGERFDDLVGKLAQEGGSGSGRRPAGIDPGASAGIPPAMPPPGADASDEVYPMDGGDEDGDAPRPSASGLPSDVMKKLRDVIQSLESLVPDDDPEGDASPDDDDMPFDMGDDDGDADDGPPPKAKKGPPEKKPAKDKPTKSKDKGEKPKDDDDEDDVDEAVDDPAALAASIGRQKYGKGRFQAMAAAGQRRRR